MIKILFVCHGNICRSPMAEFIMRRLAEEQELPLEVASAATSTEELGNPVHPGTQRVLESMGIRCKGKTARQLTKADYEAYDWLVGMDDANIRNMRAICGGDPDGKIRKLLSFCCEQRDVADPWYTGDFEKTRRDVKRGCSAMARVLFPER